ncbi:MAG: molybdopterin molybdenumtransferase MoeA, partial [Chromatiales bacterium]
VTKTGMQGSGILTSMSHANCFIILPQDSGGVEPGTVVDVQPFAGLI